MAFELAETELVSGDYEAGLDRYGVRFEAFPKLEWYKARKKYAGQHLDDEWLFVWGEQGIGDEIMFAMFLEVMVPRAKNMVIALDNRLIPAFEVKYPQWRFLDRHNLPSDLPSLTTPALLAILWCFFCLTCWQKSKYLSNQSSSLTNPVRKNLPVIGQEREASSCDILAGRRCQREW